MALVFAGLAAVIHIYIFILESLLWGRDKTNRTFGMSAEQAQANRLFAFNQGFYNLFLALAVITGLLFHLVKASAIGDTLWLYGCFSMFLAALVLFGSQKRLFRAALIQGVFPLLAILFYFLR